MLLNKDKCIYKVNEIFFLGQILTPDGNKPLNKYIQYIQNSIKKFRAPATSEELQSFLGLENYINKGIPNHRAAKRNSEGKVRKKHKLRTI